MEGVKYMYVGSELTMYMSRMYVHTYGYVHVSRYQTTHGRLLTIHVHVHIHAEFVEERAKQQTKYTGQCQDLGECMRTYDNLQMGVNELPLHSDNRDALWIT